MQLTLDAVRSLQVAAQGFQSAAPPAQKADVLATIRRMGVLQIDTINIVARSPYLVLWSRLGGYDQRWLDELLAEGALFEYWSHAACFLPIEDYALYRHSMLSRRGEHDSYYRWLQQHDVLAAQILARVHSDGPLRTSSFARNEAKMGTWWDRSPEKTTLEALFDLGYLMIARREHFQRVYELTERILPAWDDARALSPEAARRAFVLHTVKALGVAPARWVHDYYRLRKRGVVDLLAKLAAEGELDTVQVEGWDAPAYAHPANRDLIEAAASGARSELTSLLSPFDPIVWDRERALELHNFFYRIEVYTPAQKRAYGYFTLPILHRGQLVGRLDPKAHRAEGLFEVKSVHLEPGVPITEQLLHDLAATIRDCAEWHKTPEVIIRRSNPDPLAAALQAKLSA